MQIVPLLAATIAAGLLVAGACADETGGSRGTISATNGSDNSVMVLRGSKTYTLAEGDQLFEGDLVFTRSNGNATLTLSNCVVELPANASLSLDDNACDTPPTSLASNEAKGGTSSGSGIGGLTATQTTVFAGIATTAVAASAISNNGNSAKKPTSP